MSFSTPSMNPEMRERSTNKQNNLFLPRINTPFAQMHQMHQMPQMPQMPQTPQMHQTPQLPQMPHMHQMPMHQQTAFASPWHTAQFLQGHQTLPTSQQQTMWATAAPPPIEIEVYDTASKAPVDTKVSWTSAEQLADAIFPTQTENANAIEPMHHGLLNHKEQIENLYKTTEPLQNSLIDQHHGLMNHKDEIENLYQIHDDLSKKIDKQKSSLSTHQVLHSAYDTKYNNLQKSLKEMQDSSN
jgi:hypothetical protein